MKCGSCGNTTTTLNIEGFTGRVPLGKSWKCIAYTCPHCSCVQAAQMDPIALKTDTLAAVGQALGPLQTEIQNLQHEIHRLRQQR